MRLMTLAEDIEWSKQLGDNIPNLLQRAAWHIRRDMCSHTLVEVYAELLRELTK